MKNDFQIEEIPLYNSKIIDNYIKFIKKTYKNINIGELLESAKMKSYEIADEGHWFTQQQVNLFHEKLSYLTNNENIAREVGRFAASPEVLGAMNKYILGMISPAKAYALTGKAAEKFTKSAKYESIKIDDNKVEIRVTPRLGVQEQPFQCENRIGFFEAITMGFTNKLPTIDHPECVFRGGETCRYIVSWEKTFSDFWKKIRNYALLLLFLTCLTAIFINPIVTLHVIVPISVFLIFLLTSISERTEKLELQKSRNHLRGLSEQVLEKIVARARDYFQLPVLLHYLV